MERTTTTSLILALALVALIPTLASAQQISLPAIPGARSDMGIRFVPNMGQIVDTDGQPRPEIRYSAHFNGLSLYLLDDRISYVFTKVEGDLEHHRHADGFYDAEHPEPILHSYRMDMEFLGASPEVEILTEDRSSHYINYYLPHVPQGIVAVQSVGTVVYRNIYPNIDFVIYSNAAGDSSGPLKYNFVVRPGGSAYDINLRYRGATGQSIDEEIRLVTTTPFATLIEDMPDSYQQSLLARTKVDTAALTALIQKPPYFYRQYLTASKTGHANMRWTVLSRHTRSSGIVKYQISGDDRRQTLVIEPSLQWSTFYGGNGIEDLNGGHVCEVDRSGNVLVTGSVSNANFPTTTGSHYQQSFAGLTDVFIVKMNSLGELLWATIYGGNNQDLAHGIVTDRDRNVIIAGHTFSTGTSFPIQNAHQSTFGGNRDAMAVKFDSNGVRQWGTLYGGTSYEDIYGLAVDGDGNPAMVLAANSTNAIATSGSFDETHNGSYDAAIVRFNADGVRLWGTYLGSSGEEWGYGAATDSNNNISITGWTNSANLPTTSGAHQRTLGGGFDAFVFRFDSDGKHLWGTYFGGTANENSTTPGVPGFSAIATDADGNTIITGQTLSSSGIASSLQTKYGGGTDAYVAKFDNQGRRLWSTYLGGTGLDVGQGIASGAGNSVLVTGHTNSTHTTFPALTTDALQNRHGGGTDAFVVKIDAAGKQVEYGTFIGHTGNDEGVGISGSPLGSIVVAGTTNSAQFPTRNPWQPAYGGGTGNPTDAFIMLFCDIEGSPIDTSGPTVLCEGDSVTLSMPAGYTNYLWQSPTNEAISSSRQITVRDSGDYWVTLTNSAGCSGTSDTIEVRPCKISVVDPVDAAGTTTLGRALPNPASGHVSIEYSVADNGKTELFLVDMLGRKIPIVDATLQAGRHVATFEASEIPPGFYLVILQTASEQIRQNVTIVR